MNHSHSTLFSITRFQFILKRFLLLNQKNWVIGLLGAIGLVFSMWMLPVLLIDTPIEMLGFNVIKGTAMFFYLAGGLALTSRIFFELHSTTTAFQFLTLPASTLEKFIAAWFITSIAYTVVAIASLFILSVIIEMISAFRMGTWEFFKFFNPFHPDQLQRYAAYFFYHSIFLLGAIYFKKNNFLKTLLVIITFFIAMFFIIAVVGLILAFMMIADNFSFEYQLLESAAVWQSFLTYLIGIITISVFLLLGFLQLRNKQVA